jgi:stage II sporulation protein AA (anti-sigma F factor antagonist)
MSLHIETSHHRQVLVARLVGELDHHTSEQVRHQLEEEIAKGVRHIVLSLSGLTFMDSSGLGVILGRYKQITQLGGKMVVCSVNPSVYRLFELSGLFKILPIHDSEDDALSSLGVAS